MTRLQSEHMQLRLCHQEGRGYCLHWDISQGPGGLTGKNVKEGPLQGVGKEKEMSKANEALEVGNHGEILQQSK